ncbi:cell division protein FtsL [Paludifilum halophilum]|uniref:Cell division protein FtsL n=1 Tax=Paludifilum halophilum TaxID=1642702 RepID=A0A235B2V7_9BACL|nr:cell division protein FtsL [Paludifilum halophilum]OYD06613.1 cell division protein FtsL [Paludifilum halophilum]
MRENRGNVSVAYQLEQPDRAAKREKQPLRRGLPAGEKLLYLLSVCLCVAIASLVLSRYAVMTELNMRVSDWEQKTVQLQEANRQLETERKELASAERIRRFAEENGMILMEQTRTLSDSPRAEGPKEKAAPRDERG